MGLAGVWSLEVMFPISQVDNNTAWRIPSIIKLNYKTSHLVAITQTC